MKKEDLMFLHILLCEFQAKEKPGDILNRAITLVKDSIEVHPKLKDLNK